jgi:putative ATPase
MQHQPLANLLRPEHLDNYVGQQHLIGENGPIRQLCERNQICSMILWGPPGCGKTSLVYLLEKYWQLPIINLSAITSGIKDIKALVAQDGKASQVGLFSTKKIVFVDEIHRFNKTQQDAFLPHVESGAIVLIGASTENPAFSVNSALLSRMRVFTLHKLNDADLNALLLRAMSEVNQGKPEPLLCEQQAIDLLIQLADGDARRLLTNFEVATSLVTTNILTEALVIKASGERIANFDKSGDHYYDTLSAFHKSIRGSSVDGGLFWYARLLLASSDVTPICRRLLAIASEDIGNADPKALGLCLDAWDVYHRVGAAEGERAIAQAVVYCALAPKSNAVYVAFKQAKRLAAEHATQPVPFHLRNATSKITKDLGHGKGYQYAHNYDHAYTPEQSYLPDAMTEQDIYQPSERGFESKLKQKMDFLKHLQNLGN